ncbi:unnamed protein product [Ostreobium quekettii]|uniref:RRM domain-containing protein n=1 Tax=Ostreobium quekettii TaxID=121088 RepID=A0A8S1IP74_9CHLO|nr:unnamed protein product [Ostreobium quekettii]
MRWALPAASPLALPAMEPAHPHGKDTGEPQACDPGFAAPTCPKAPSSGSLEAPRTPSGVPADASVTGRGDGAVDGDLWTGLVGRSWRCTRREQPGVPSGRILCVENVGPSFNNEGLERLFPKFGTITSTKVLSKSTGESHDIGVVCYSTADEASRPLSEMNKQSNDNCRPAGQPTIVAGCVEMDEAVSTEDLSHGPRHTGTAEEPDRQYSPARPNLGGTKMGKRATLGSCSGWAFSALVGLGMECVRGALRNSFTGTFTGILLLTFASTVVRVTYPTGAADLAPIMNSVQLLQAQRLDLTTRKKDFVALGAGRLQIGESISTLMDDGGYWNLLYPSSRGLLLGSSTNTLGDKIKWQMMNTLCVTGDDKDGDGVAVANTRRVSLSPPPATELDVKETCEPLAATFSARDRFETFGSEQAPPEFLSCFYLATLGNVDNLALVEENTEQDGRKRREEEERLKRDLEMMAEGRVQREARLLELDCGETIPQTWLGVTRFLGLPSGENTTHIDVFWEASPAEGGELILRRQLTRNAAWDIEDLQVRLWQPGASGELEELTDQQQACDVIQKTFVTIGSSSEEQAVAFTLVQGRGLTNCDEPNIGARNLDISERAFSSLLTELDRKVGQERPQEDTLPFFLALVLGILATTIIEVRLTIVLDRGRKERRWRDEVAEKLLLATRGRVPFQEYRDLCYHKIRRMKNWQLYKTSVMLASILVLTAPIFLSMVGSLRARNYTEEVVVVDTADVATVRDLLNRTEQLDVLAGEIFRNEPGAVAETLAVADIWVGRAVLTETDTQFGERMAVAVLAFLLSIAIAIFHIWDNQMLSFLHKKNPLRPRNFREERMLLVRLRDGAVSGGEYIHREDSTPMSQTALLRDSSARNGEGHVEMEMSELAMYSRKGSLLAMLPSVNHLWHT